MTVGIAAIADGDTDDPSVVIAADKMLTTQQQSAIEHEHPETKLSRLATCLDNVEILSVFAGSVTLAEDLQNKVNEALTQTNQQHPDYTWTVRDVSKIAAEQYRALIQEKINNMVLSQYGLELDDLSKQHQFKDSFFNDVWSQARHLEEEISNNLVLLMGGVDHTGAYIFQVRNEDVTGHNDIGYATIGSGTQPAQSEFIKSEYGRSDSFHTALATVAAANQRAAQARGVGRDLDIGIVERGTTEFAHNEMVEGLKERQGDIADEQEAAKQAVLEDNPIQWRSS